MIAVRIKNHLRESGIIARLGGDEFITLIDSVKDNESVTSISSSLISELSKKFNIAGNGIYIGASIGISFFPEHGFETNILVTKADKAMYTVKRNDKNNWGIYQK